MEVFELVDAGPLIVDEPPPAVGEEDYVDGEELPDPDGEPDDECDDWDDPDDETPLLRRGYR